MQNEPTPNWAVRFMDRMQFERERKLFERRPLILGLCVAEVARLLAFLAACPALMSLIGYATDRKYLTNWSDGGTPMALPTAISLFLGMMAVILLSTVFISRAKDHSAK